MINMCIRQLHGYILFLVLLFCSSGYSQVWPGDVNGNGEVNNIDLIYLGYVFGHTGPKRLNTSTEWSEQYLPAEWAESFPGGANWAHADCNGDGLISEQDLITVMINFGKVRPGFEPDLFIEGTPGIDPPIAFNPSEIENAYALGSEVKDLMIELGSENIPIDDLIGIAFTIEYDPDVIQANSLILNLTDNWISTDPSEAFFGQQPVESGELQVALSRFGQNAVEGSGLIGSLSYIIIEDNLIGLQAEDTTSTVLCIKDVKLFNSFMEEIPIVPDCLDMGVFDPTLVSLSGHAGNKNGFRLFPNPASDHIYLYPADPGNEVRIYNLLGNELLRAKVASRNGTIDISALPKGVYFIQIEKEERLFKFIKK